MIIKIILFGILFLISAFYAIRGLVTGNTRYGYKYYGKGVSANRKESPGSFWFGIVLYGATAVVSLIMILTTIEKMM